MTLFRHYGRRTPIQQVPLNPVKGAHGRLGLIRSFPAGMATGGDRATLSVGWRWAFGVGHPDCRRGLDGKATCIGRHMPIQVLAGLRMAPSCWRLAPKAVNLCCNAPRNGSREVVTAGRAPQLRGRGTVPRRVHTPEVAGSTPARATANAGHDLAERCRGLLTRAGWHGSGFCWGCPDSCRRLVRGGLAGLAARHGKRPTSGKLARQRLAAS